MAERLNLVTGACGFSGSNLVKWLLDNNEKVIATDLANSFESEKCKMIFKNIGLDFKHPNVTVIPANLLDPESLKPLFKHKITHLFHTASLYDYSAEMEKLRSVNIDGFLNLVNLAADAKLKRFIHWSTCGIFGKPYTLNDGKLANTPFTEESHSPKNTPFEVDEPPGTYLVNEYSVTKWKQEQWAWKYHREKGLPLTVIRPAPMYGPGSDYGHGGIIIAFHKWILGHFIPLDAKNYITTSVHVDDLSRFAYFISNRDDAIGEDFNIVDDSVISYYDFLRYISLLLGKRVYSLPFINLKILKPIAIWAAKKWYKLEKRYGIPRIRVFEVQSATYIGSSYWISNRKSKDWGYAYRYPDVREGLRDTIAWFRKVGWLE